MSRSVSVNCDCIGLTCFSKKLKPLFQWTMSQWRGHNVSVAYYLPSAWFWDWLVARTKTSEYLSITLPVWLLGQVSYRHVTIIIQIQILYWPKKHGPRKALMTYMYRWHKCQFKRYILLRLFPNNKTLLRTSTRICIIIWHFSHIILYECINTSVSPCILVCYTYRLTCRQKQGNAMYGVRTAISINIYHTKLCNSGPFTCVFLCTI